MVNITKASGESAIFNPDKLRASLQRVGADKQLIEIILQEVEDQLAEGMSTQKIYQIAFRLLRKKSRVLASKYHLKKAIMRLGTAGYSFEKYISELLGHSGYMTTTNQVVSGFCVSHEVDVIAVKDNKKAYIECKYHNRQGKKCDVKVTLYIKARVLDIIRRNKLSPTDLLSGWVVTNTRFTTDAEQYGMCSGLHLVGWDFPKKNNLKEMIEISRLYPITCISSFSQKELQHLFNKKVMLCKTIAEHPEYLDSLRLSKQKHTAVVQQCQSLCAMEHT